MIHFLSLSRVLPAVFISCTGLLHAGPGAANDFGGKRVLFIGIDGLRPDALQQVMADGKAPNLKKIIDGGTVTWKAQAGGNFATPTQQPTISGPGWTSIHTGTLIDRHQVDDNNTPPVDQPGQPGSYLVSKAPHFVRYLKDAHPSVSASSITSWAWIEDYLIAAQASLFDYHVKSAGKDYEERDLHVKKLAVDRLATADPDLMLLHFDQVDGAGHATGFTPMSTPYRAAIGIVDSLIGDVLAAVEKRPEFAQEKWLVLLTTDHGGLGKNHGGQSREERTIFIAARGEGIPAGLSTEERIGHAAVAPTIFRFLGVPADPAWGWAEKPLSLADPEGGFKK